MAEVTTHDYGDGEVFPSLLDGINDDVEQVSGDGAYDTLACHEAIAEKGARATIPPRRGARYSSKESRDHPRDRILQRVDDVGREQLKQESGYRRRSLAETTMFRFKQAFGGKLCSRLFENQAAELFLQSAALNRMIQVAKPCSFPLPAPA